MLVVRPDGWIAAYGRESGHIENGSNLVTSAPDLTTASMLAAVAREWCHADELGDLLSIQRSEFGYFSQERP